MSKIQVILILSLLFVSALCQFPQWGGLCYPSNFQDCLLQPQKPVCLTVTVHLNSKMDIKRSFTMEKECFKDMYACRMFDPCKFKVIFYLLLHDAI